MTSIVIEGIDGSGKTSVAIRLATALRGKIVQTSKYDFLKGVQEYVNRNPRETLTRFVYYLSLNRYLTRILQENPSELYIIDRYVYSTITTHLALDEIHNSGFNCEAIKRIFHRDIGTIAAPDIAAFLYVDMENRLQRIASREGSTNSPMDYDNGLAGRTQELLREFAQELRSEGKTTVVEIETSQAPLDVVTQRIIDTYLVSNVSPRGLAFGPPSSSAGEALTQ
jgi:thymidylate kinase